MVYYDIPGAGKDFTQPHFTKKEVPITWPPLSGTITVMRLKNFQGLKYGLHVFLDSMDWLKYIGNTAVLLLKHS